MLRPTDPANYGYGTVGVLTRSGGQSCTVGGRPWYEWALMCSTFLNIICFLAFTVIDLVVTMQDLKFVEEAAQIIGPPDAGALISNITKGFPDPTFTFDLIALLSTVLALILIVYGMFAERKYEICLCPIIMGLSILYLIAEAAIGLSDTNAWCNYARICICGGLTLVSWPLTARTVSESTWYEFTITGTSDGLMGMYRRLRYFTALLKLDFFLVAVLGIFCLRNGLQSDLRDFLFMFGIFIFALLCVIIGTIAVNRETKQLVFAFIVLSVLLYLWIPFQIMTFDCLLPGLSNCNAARTLSVGCVISTGALTATIKTYVFIELLQVYKNFGFGLTDAAFASLVGGESSSLLGRPRRRF